MSQVNDPSTTCFCASNSLSLRGVQCQIASLNGALLLLEERACLHPPITSLWASTMRLLTRAQIIMVDGERNKWLRELSLSPFRSRKEPPAQLGKRVPGLHTPKHGPHAGA